MKARGSQARQPGARAAVSGRRCCRCCCCFGGRDWYGMGFVNGRGGTSKAPVHPSRPADLEDEALVPLRLVEHHMRPQPLLRAVRSRHGGVVDPHDVSLRGGLDNLELGPRQIVGDLGVVGVDSDGAAQRPERAAEVPVQRGRRWQCGGCCGRLLDFSIVHAETKGDGISLLPGPTHAHSPQKSQINRSMHPLNAL